MIQKRHGDKIVPKDQAPNSHKRQHASQYALGVTCLEIHTLVAVDLPNDVAPPGEMKVSPPFNAADERVPLATAIRCKLANRERHARTPEKKGCQRAPRGSTMPMTLRNTISTRRSEQGNSAAVIAAMRNLKPSPKCAVAEISYSRGC